MALTRTLGTGTRTCLVVNIKERVANARSFFCSAFFMNLLFTIAVLTLHPGCYLHLPAIDCFFNDCLLYELLTH